MNWLDAMNWFQEEGITTLLECGPSTALAKNAKFVEGIRFSPLSSIFPATSAGS
jgi:hypothetical protein